MELNNILELIITNKEEKYSNVEMTDLQQRMDESISHINSQLERSNSISDDSPNIAEFNKPYFELTDKYIEALSQFVSRFNTKEKYCK